MVPLPRPELTDTILAWAQYYHSHGIAVIPTRGGTKQAIYQWKPYQTRLPTDDEIIRWFARTNFDETGIAMVTGAGSNNTNGIDVDLREFADDLQIKGTAVLQATWTQLSGSGKIHVITRSSQTIPSTSVKGRDGKLVADICAGGHILMLAPSRHFSGGRYQILYGGPEAVAMLEDPGQLLRSLHERWAGGIPTAARDDESPPQGADMSIQPPCDEPRQAELRKRLQSTHAKCRAGIFQTEGWFEYFRLADQPRLTIEDRRSEVHFDLTGFLIEQNWDDEDIEDVFASFPCGNLCYARPDRDHHGHSFVVTKIVRWREKRNKAVEAATDLDGIGWRIVRSYKRDYGDDPHFDLRAHCMVNKRTRDMTVMWEDVHTEKRLMSELSKRLDYVCRLPAHLSGRNYDRFLQRLLDISILEETPEEVSHYGHLRAMFGSILSRDGALVLYPNEEGNEPRQPGQFRIGWADTEWLHVRGTVVLHELALMLRPTPLPGRVWDSMSEIGAKRERYAYDDGSTEDLWKIPRSKLRI